MFRFLLIALGALGWSQEVQAQHLFAQAASGVLRTSFSEDNYHPSLAVPVGIRLGGGSNKFQLGLQYQRYAYAPTFAFKDPFTENVRFREKLQESLAGVFARFNSAGDASTTGFTLRASADYLFVTRTTVMSDGKIYEEAKLDRTPCFTGAMGLAIRLTDLLRLTAEGTYSVCNRNRADYAVQPVGDEKFATATYGLQLGVAAYIIK
jgi:hypothetical protein